MTENEMEMRAAIDEFSKRLTAQDGEIAEIRAGQETANKRLNAGAEFMHRLDEKMSAVAASTDALALATQPAVDAVLTMRAGIEFMGKVGNGVKRVGRFMGKVGEWGWAIAKLGVLLAGIWVFVKSVILGQPLASAWGDFVRIIK